MKKILIIIVFLLFPEFELLSNEPFVILEYQGNNFENSNQKKINRNNKFLKNQNYSVIHKVKDGESLSGILNKYYGNTGLNMKIVEISIIEINKHAFVRDNPHFLYAGKKIKIPSVNEIMNLVKSKPNRMSGSKVNNKSHIYFFGN